MNRTCYRCKCVFPLEAFKKDKRATLGYGYTCIPCARALARQYASKATEAQKEAARNQRRQMVLRAQLYICNYLVGKVCSDCGEDDLELLDFDHTDSSTKTLDVCTLVRRGSIKKLQAEIARCDIVCCSCHRKRTNRRGNYYRYRFVLGNLQELISEP